MLTVPVSSCFVRLIVDILVLRPPALGVAIFPCALYLICVQVLPVRRGRSPTRFKAEMDVKTLSFDCVPPRYLAFLVVLFLLLKFSVLFSLFVY